VSKKTVRELLDQLAEGKVSLADVAADFALREWPPMRKASEAQVWGVADDDPVDPNSWEAVNIDSRLTPEQYNVLGRAKLAASKG
jgi:hypothetical protein